MLCPFVFIDWFWQGLFCVCRRILTGSFCGRRRNLTGSFWAFWYHRLILTGSFCVRRQSLRGSFCVRRLILIGSFFAVVDGFWHGLFVVAVCDSQAGLFVVEGCRTRSFAVAGGVLHGRLAVADWLLQGLVCGRRMSMRLETDPTSVFAWIRPTWPGYLCG